MFQSKTGRWGDDAMEEVHHTEASRATMYAISPTSSWPPYHPNSDPTAIVYTHVGDMGDLPRQYSVQNECELAAAAASVVSVTSAAENETPKSLSIMDDPGVHKFDHVRMNTHMQLHDPFPGEQRQEQHSKDTMTESHQPHLYKNACSTQEATPSIWSRKNMEHVPQVVRILKRDKPNSCGPVFVHETTNTVTAMDKRTTSGIHSIASSPTQTNRISWERSERKSMNDHDHAVAAQRSKGSRSKMGPLTPEDEPQQLHESHIPTYDRNEMEDRNQVINGTHPMQNTRVMVLQRCTSVAHSTLHANSNVNLTTTTMTTTTAETRKDLYPGAALPATEVDLVRETKNDEDAEAGLENPAHVVDPVAAQTQTLRFLDLNATHETDWIVKDTEEQEYLRSSQDKRIVDDDDAAFGVEKGRTRGEVQIMSWTEERKTNDVHHPTIMKKKPRKTNMRMKRPAIYRIKTQTAPLPTHDDNHVNTSSLRASTQSTNETLAVVDDATVAISAANTKNHHDQNHPSHLPHAAHEEEDQDEENGTISVSTSRPETLLHCQRSRRKKDAYRVMG